MASRQFQSLMAMFRARPVDPDATLEELREGFERIVELFPAPQDIATETTETGGIPAEWITPAGATENGVLFFLHGGGYSIGSLATHRALAADLARAAGIRALSIAYRLAPEHPFPAAVEDATAAYRGLLTHGAPPDRIVIAGDSAGGGLTLATLAALHDAGDPLPAGAVGLSPWTDLAGTGESAKSKARVDPLLTPEELHTFAERYLGGADPRTPLASPLYADLRGFPPLLLHVGECEILLDDATRVADRARDAGVDVTLSVWPEMVHVWHFFASVLPEGREAVDEVGAFIRARLDSGQVSA